MAAGPAPVVLSWSGGKDCLMALDSLRREGTTEVVALLTSVTRGYDRVSIHGVRRSLLDAQAAAIGIPLVCMELDPDSGNAAYEAAQRSAFAGLRRRFPELRRIAYGDLFLEDVRQWREARLKEQGLEGLFPLWGRDTAVLAREVIASGVVAHLTTVDTTRLDSEFAGRAFDEALLAELPPSVDPCGERGEFHTFVSWGPGFIAPVEVEPGERVLRDGRFMYADLLPAAAATPGVERG